jgi:hypothetical protein
MFTWYTSHVRTVTLCFDLFEDPRAAAKNGEKLMNADDWVAIWARNWNKQNYKDASSYKASCGTEHNRDQGIVMLDKPPKEIEAV